MEYNEYLKEQFGDLKINLVRHNTSPTSYPCYIEVLLGKAPKDKGTTAKDLSNYLFRLGFHFQSCPEYGGRGKKATFRFYMSWDNLAPYLHLIKDKYGQGHVKAKDYLPWEFRSLVIQDSSRGVHPNV